MIDNRSFRQPTDSEFILGLAIIGGCVCVDACILHLMIIFFWRKSLNPIYSVEWRILYYCCCYCHMNSRFFAIFSIIISYVVIALFMTRNFRLISMCPSSYHSLFRSHNFIVHFIYEYKLCVCVCSNGHWARAATEWLYDEHEIQKKFNSVSFLHRNGVHNNWELIFFHLFSLSKTKIRRQTAETIDNSLFKNSIWTKNERIISEHFNFRMSIGAREFIGGRGWAGIHASPFGEFR